MSKKDENQKCPRCKKKLVLLRTRRGDELVELRPYCTFCGYEGSDAWAEEQEDG